MDISDFENAIATTDDKHKQLKVTEGGGVTLKSSDLSRRLATWAQKSDRDDDRKLIQDFRTELEKAYGPDAAKVAWEDSGLAERFEKGKPLSVGVAATAIQQAKTALILQNKLLYEQAYDQKNQEALAWTPTPVASQVQGSGLRLNSQDQGEVRVHNWLARNDYRPDRKPPVAVLELDELVHAEVQAIKNERQLLQSQNQQVPPMSERLIYLQAKLNITERMVAEASKPENLKPGGPTANVFLGPDMFFCPSDGPVVNGIKTYGGALTEEEMKQFTKGLTEISKRHPELTLMPGTFVWSKPSTTIPKVDGLPRPCDMVFNTGPVLNKGELKHIVYKKKDGGDANWAAEGVNGVGKGGYVAPSKDNDFGARLQVFAIDENINNKLGNQGVQAVEGVKQELEQLAAANSPQRTWEDQLRQGGSQERSPHNTFFIVEDKVMAMEICRDHSDGVGSVEYLKAFKDPSMQDEVIKKARQQPGISGGANVHVMLSASNSSSPGKSICCDGGTLAQNDVSGGMSVNFTITKRIDDYNIKSTGKQETFTYNLDKQRLEQNTPKVVEQNDLEVSGLSEIQLDDEYVTDLKQSGDDRDLEGIGSLEEVVTEEDLTETLTTEVKVESKPKLEKHPSVRDLIKPGHVANAKAQLGLEEDPSTKVGNNNGYKRGF